MTDTRSQLLDLAQALAQQHGYNGFSFHDLARDIGIKTASVHYHFPTKAHLGQALMVRYRELFSARLDDIDRDEKDPRRKLERFTQLFEETLASGDKLCLCGMLASEFETLPEVVQEEVRTFFLTCEQWLERVLAQGRKLGVFTFEGSPETTAQTLFSSLEGAMISARTFADRGRLAGTARWLVEALALPARSPRRRNTPKSD